MEIPAVAEHMAEELYMATRKVIRSSDPNSPMPEWKDTNIVDRSFWQVITCVQIYQAENLGYRIIGPSSVEDITTIINNCGLMVRTKSETAITLIEQLPRIVPELPGMEP